MPPGPARPLRNERFALLAGLALAGFAVVLLGLLRLQVVQHDDYQRLAQENRVRLEVLRAPRGAIRDRHGELLADNRPSFSMVFRPMPAESVSRARQPVRSDWVMRVAALVGVDTLEVRRRVEQANRSGETAILRRNSPYEVMAAVEEMRGDLTGIDVVVEPIRHYPHGTLAAHLLGYAGEINDQELAKRAEQNYRPGDLLGKTGIEYRYEDQLRGQDGAEFVVVNARGKRVSTITEGPPRLPIPGRDLVLTIDLKVQQALEDGMANIERGAAVALDPRDGSVLGMVSRPNFDPNEISRGMTHARWAEINMGEAKPLLNRAMGSAYPPGSTFKIVTSLAALKYGLVDRNTHEPVSCNGGYNFGGRRFGCWNKNGHGSVDLIHALAQSCDVFYYQLGPKIGLDHLEATARALGMGARTGIDLPAEYPGLIPSKDYYDRRWGAGNWRNGLLLNLAIGQGELLVTPLQLAVMMAGACNGGRAVRPHVVKQVRGAPEFKIARPLQSGIDVSPEQWLALHDGMEAVINPGGTGGGARVPGFRVGGKTGTAQNPHGNDHALFVCYAPAENPTIVIAVVAENSGHGGTIGAPVAGLVLRRMLLPDSVTPHQGPGARRDTLILPPPDSTQVLD